MEQFTVIIKNIYNATKSRKITVKAEDTWLAHKLANTNYNQLYEDIASIKDSKNNEVYNIETGFMYSDE